MQLKLGPAVIDKDSIAKAVMLAARPKIVQYANDLAENGERLATAAARNLYDTNRPANRRRDPGSNRLGSGVMFQGRVEITGDGAIVTFRVLGGGDKFNALNYGSRAHEIRPRNKKALSYPGGSNDTGFSTKAPHPGTTGSGFWEKAIAQARQITRVS